MTQSMRPSTLRTLGLGSAADIFRSARLPAEASELVDRVFGKPGERGSLVISGAKGSNFLTWACLHHLAEQYGALFRPTPDLEERRLTGQNWYPLNISGRWWTGLRLLRKRRSSPTGSKVPCSRWSATHQEFRDSPTTSGGRLRHVARWRPVKSSLFPDTLKNHRIPGRAVGAA
jgi:hypothetical protein